MTAPHLSHESKTVEHEVGAFLERSEKRGRSSGAAGCLLVIVSVIVLGSMGALASKGGWVILVVGAVMLFGMLTKQAVKRSAEDFQHTFRSATGAERRDQALQVLWARAHGAAEKSPAGKAAKEVLEHLGIKVRPSQRRPDVELGPREPEPMIVTLPAPELRHAPPPRVPTPVVRPTVDPRVHAPKPAAPKVEHPSVPAPQVHERPKSKDSVRERAHVPQERAPALPPLAASPALPPMHSASPLSPARVNSPAPPSSPAHGASFGSSPTRVSCDSCGGVRTVPAGEAAGLCPVCYPQIRLEG